MPEPRTIKYRLYVDEVGNSDLGNADNPNHRFLSLTGIICSLDHVQSVVHPQLEDLKVRYFGTHPDEPIILHRKEMVNKMRPFEALRDPQVDERFRAELLGLLKSWDYHLITVVIDKQEHNRTYTVWRHDPYHYCMSVLLERYMFFLRNRGATGDVMAESRGGKEDMRLKKSYNRLYEEGTDFVKPELFAEFFTSRQLKVKQKSSNIAGLQITDLIAHPSRRAILLENRLIQDSRSVFGDEIERILDAKYYRSGQRIFGKKILP